MRSTRDRDKNATSVNVFWRGTEFAMLTPPAGYRALVGAEAFGRYYMICAHQHPLRPYLLMEETEEIGKFSPPYKTIGRGAVYVGSAREGVAGTIGDTSFLIRREQQSLRKRRRLLAVTLGSVRYEMRYGRCAWELKGPSGIIAESSFGDWSILESSELESRMVIALALMKVADAVQSPLSNFLDAAIVSI